MQVDMNGLRRSIALNYNTICRTLNSNIQDGDLTITPEDIQDEMDELRNDIVFLLACFNDNEMRVLSEEVKLEHFNDQLPTEEEV